MEISSKALEEAEQLVISGGDHPMKSTRIAIDLEPVYATYDGWRENQGTSKYQFCPWCGSGLILNWLAGKERPACPRCNYVCFRNPYPAVSVLVIQDGQVLLGKRSGDPGRDKWSLPSGYVEFEEDFISTGVREVQEETGLQVEIDEVLSVQSAFLPPDYHFLGIYLLGRVVNGTLQAGDDLQELGWFPVANPLPEMAFETDKNLIAGYAKRVRLGTIFE
jgi:ADP-ribose pyrophosphatase YjhB (NUDIX family)